ncbi:MAG: NAD(P)-dependent oxidoreductase, partial [Dehalococcoidia bacterium]|nr:NAD(P)-dependent oxidoreductase [Dehalococcoidia bacterium]
SPRDVARASEIVFTSLPKPSDVEQVVLGEGGVITGAAPGTLMVDMSTNSPRLIQGIADTAAETGIEVLDAPVTGGIRGAKKATLGIMVGGSEKAFEQCRPVLEAMGNNVYHMGGVGMGNVAKLTNNLLSLTNSLVAMEGMVMGAKAGLDVQKLWRVINTGSGNSFIFENFFPYIIFKGRWEPPTFPIDLVLKDLGLAVEEAERAGAPVPMAKLAIERFKEAADSGLGRKDVGAAITMLEKVAGIEVRVAQP